MRNFANSRVNAAWCIWLCVLMTFSFLFGCARAYNEPQGLSPEDVQMANRVAEMNTLVETFVQEAADEESLSLDAFASASAQFNQAAQRFGTRSLKTRRELDLTRYQAAQLDPVLTEKDYPELYPAWQKIRVDLDDISRTMGYKVPESPE